MTAKHTPGPWKIVGNAYGLPCIYSADLTECITDRVFNGNENILQAAPDLLQALEDCITNDRATCIVQNDVAYMIRRFKAINDICRAAIARATGAK